MVTDAAWWPPQVDYITRNGWTPCLEFAEADQAYVSDNFTGAPTLSSCAHLRSICLCCTKGHKHRELCAALRAFCVLAGHFCAAVSPPACTGTS